MYGLTTINRVYNENLDEWKAIESGLAVIKTQTLCSVFMERFKIANFITKSTLRLTQNGQTFILCHIYIWHIYKFSSSVKRNERRNLLR